MSRLSFSEEEGYWKGDERGNEEGEKESEKGVVWEELEMGRALYCCWFDSCNCAVLYFYSNHCVQSETTNEDEGIEGMKWYYDFKVHYRVGCTKLSV